MASCLDIPPQLYQDCLDALSNRLPCWIAFGHGKSNLSLAESALGPLAYLVRAELPSKTDRLMYFCGGEEPEAPKKKRDNKPKPQLPACVQARAFPKYVVQDVFSFNSKLADQYVEPRQDSVKAARRDITPQAHALGVAWLMAKYNVSPLGTEDACGLSTDDFSEYVNDLGRLLEALIHDYQIFRQIFRQPIDL